MEVRPGYKQTHFGEFPIDWSESTVGDEFKVQLGKMVDAARNDGVAKPYLGNAAVKWGAIDVSEIQTIRLSENELERFRLRRGDLLVCEGRGVGRSAVWEDQLPECYYQKALHRLRPRRGFDPRLMIALFRYWVDQGLLSNYVTESTIPHLTKEKLVLIPLAVHPQPEQRAIAAAVSDVDALLEGLTRLIAKKRDLKQAALQQLLTGQTRLPGFYGEWEVKRLGDICKVAMGRTPSRLNQAYWGRGYVWLSIADLQAKVMTQSKEEITELAASTMTIVPKGTLLMSFKLSIGRLCFAGCDLFTNEAICSFNELKAHADFLYYALGRTDFSLYGKQAVKGYTLNKESLKIVEVRLPSLPEQAAIAAVLSDLDAELTALEVRRNKTRALKQAMMQELLTGRTRLV